MSRPLSPRAFTLIELLIVVAIIAILAAIAVPNFLEAQVRAKVSRAKADMRTLATATEAYAVDHNRYPWPSDEHGNQIGDFLSRQTEENTPWFETRTSVLLTTPVAYITSRLEEPFGIRGAEEDPQFHFGSKAYTEQTEGDAGAHEWEHYLEDVSGREGLPATWFYLSHGPDLDHDFEHDHGAERQAEEEENHPALYDPTNGTISSGDVLFLGPGIGLLQ